MDSESRKAAKEGVKKVKKISKILTFVFSPAVAFIGGIFIFLIAILIAVFVVLGLLDDSDSEYECINIKSADEVCKTITTSDLGTISVDEYVADVVSQEVGGMTDEGFDTYKAYAIAARTYALYHSYHGSNGASRDSNGNCTVPKGTAFQDYNTNPDENVKAAANETSGMILVNGDQLISSEYDAFAWYKEEGGYFYLMQRDQKVPSDWIRNTKGKKEEYIQWCYEHKHGRGMSQNGAWYLADDQNYSYDKILDYYYGSKTDYNAELASSKGSSSSCPPKNNGDLKPLDNYKTNHDGLKVLDHTLSKSEKKSLNDYLDKEIKAAGYGTGAGVAAAGQSLVYWLEQNGYYLQYFWGGGQGAGDSEVVGASPNWGSTSYGYDPKGHGNHFGMDCSGFVSWAVRTGCAPKSGAREAKYWLGFGKGISLNEAKPGDVIASQGHAMLVVKNNGDGTVYVAEENDNLGFTLIGSGNMGGRTVVDMTKWYKDNCEKGS